MALRQTLKDCVRASPVLYDSSDRDSTGSLWILRPARGATIWVSTGRTICMENAAQPHTKCYSLFDQAQLGLKSTLYVLWNERTRSACRHDEL
jgi:hypothetical protein